MKTFCVVTSNSSYTIHANDVFEVASEIGMSEKALRIALLLNRPLSVRVPWGWQLKNGERIPVKLASGAMLRRVYTTSIACASS